MLNDMLADPATVVVDENELARLVDEAFGLMTQGSWATARTVLGEAIVLGPNYAQLHEAFGTACYRLGDLRGATEAFSRAIELAPDNVELMVQAALVANESGSHETAKALLTRARALDSKHPALEKFWAGFPTKQPPVVAVPAKIDFATAKKTLREVTLDQGLAADIGDYSYVHGKHIRNPSGARTHIRIGKFSSIATGLTIIGYDHRMDWISTYPFLDSWHREVWSGTTSIPHPAAPELGGNIDRGDIVIGNDVWIGCDVKIFKGVTIGHGAVIGACSLVNKDVPPYTVVAGIPARPIRRRFRDEDCRALLELAWWDWPEEKINRFLPYLCSGRIDELHSLLRAEAADPECRASAVASATLALDLEAGRKARAQVHQFIDEGRKFFRDVHPPRLEERHLKNSRMLPSRRHILEHMPKGGICAEIGTQTGHFAKAIMATMRPRKLHIYDIDFTPFDVEHFASALDQGIVELHRGDSSSLLAKMPDRSFDFIYVDGDHAYEGVCRDLTQAARKIKDGGWIVCNDYTPYSPLEKMPYGVYRAVNELCLREGFEIVYLGLHSWGYHDVALRRIGAGAGEARFHSSA